MPPETIAAIGALFSGLAALMTSAFSMKRARKKAMSECDERVKEIHLAFRSGLGYEKRKT